MGKVIKKKIQGMSWLTKTSLVLLLTLTSMVFMYEGWYKPRQALTATVTYNANPGTATSVGANGSTNVTSVTSFTYTSTGTTNQYRILTNTTIPTGTVQGRIRQGAAWTGTNQEILRVYTPTYASSTSIAANVASHADVYVRTVGTSASMTAQIYEYNDTTGFVGAAKGSGTATINATVTTTQTLAITINNPTFTIASGNRAVVVYSFTANNSEPVLLFGAATGTQMGYTSFTLNESVGGGNLSLGDNSVSSANALQASTGNALDGFTMFMSSGSGTVSTITITGNANFNATNIPTNGVKIYRDAGVIGVLDGADTLLSSGSTAIAGNATTVTLSTAESVTTSTGNYLVVIDLNVGAVVANTISATVSGAAGSGLGTPVDNDTASATLTVTAGDAVTVSDGTNPANANAARSSTNNALDSFTMVSTGADTVNTLTLTGSANFTTANITGIKVYADNGTIGTFDGADVLIPTTYSAITGGVTTITFTTPESVSTTTKNYLITVDIAAAATLAQTFTGRITAGTGNYVSATFNDTASATLTITAAQTLTVGNGTNPVSSNIGAGGTQALDAFTLGLNTGNATVNTLTLTGSANFSTANISSASIYADNGTVGTYEAGTDTLIPSNYSQVGTAGTITFTTPESVTAAAKNYLVLVTTKTGATLSQSFTGTITAATGTGIGTPAYNDSASATLTIVSAPVSSIVNCGGCHAYPAGTNTTFDAGTRGAGLFRGTHDTHVTTYSYTCSQCHRVPATTTSADFNHQDGRIRMANPIDGKLNAKYGNVTSWTITNTPAFNTCNTTNCHGQKSPVWASTASTTQCTKCHGQANAAYLTNYSSSTIAPGGSGVDTGGNSAAASARVGVHQGHLTAATGISAAMKCSSCHTAVTPASLAAHLNRTTASVVFNGTAIASGHTPGTTRAGGVITCNNTYCHAGKLNSGAAMSPAWNATGYLSGSMTLTDCKQCHGMPPTPGAGAHASVSALAAFPATTCGCHANLSSGGTTYANIFVDKSIHVDGKIDVSACDSCHGFPPTSGAHTTHINKLLALKGLGAIPAGFVNNQVCGTCHNDSSTTMHKGDNALATTRNIYSPSATAYQLTYQFGVNPPSYDKAGTTTCSNISCHLGTSTAWGATVISCNNCHGYPPVTIADPVDNKHAGTAPVNHIGTGASANTKATFVSVHGGCRICHGTQDSGTGSHSAHVNYDPLTQHASGSINMNGPTAAASSNSTQYDGVVGSPTRGGCNAACHANDATHRMTASSLTLAYGSYGPGGDCVSCHQIPQGTRSAVSTEFGLAWGHKKSGRTAVTKSDCIVCHLEGDFTTQSVDSTYHLGLPGGNIDLRDPDGTLNGGKTPITNISGGSFTFTKFAISYAAGSRTTTGHTSNTDIANVITQKFCLACHDANGATNTTARTRNAANTATTGTAFSPFEGINLGATYTTANGAAAAGGLIDAKTQFATANISRHPVLGPRSAGYPTTAKMIAPYNNFTRTAGTLANSVVMNCFDCHNVPGASPLLTRTVSAHGNAATIRGVSQVSVSGPTATTGTTLCLVCHTNGTGSNHATGSAFASGGQSPMNTYTQFGCNICHGSGYNAAQLPARPIKAQNVHGFTTAASGPVTTKRAFIRGNTTDAYITQFAPGSCTGMGGTICGSSRTESYTPGGVY